MSSLHPLEHLGLDTKTVRVYLANLSVQAASASELAKRARVSRASVYRCLDVLKDKDLVHEETREGKACFSPTDPQMLPQLLERQTQDLRTILPSLSQIFQAANGHVPRFRFYGEASGIRVVLEEVLQCEEKQYDIFGSIYDDEFILSVTEKYLADWMERRIKAGIYHRSLRPQSIKETYKTKNIRNPLFVDSGAHMKREIRFAPKGVEFPVLIYLFDHKVAFVNPKLGHQFAAVLESEDMHASLKTLFEFLWQVSEPEK